MRHVECVLIDLLLLQEMSELDSEGEKEGKDRLVDGENSVRPRGGTAKHALTVNWDRGSDLIPRCSLRLKPVTDPVRHASAAEMSD